MEDYDCVDCKYLKRDLVHAADFFAVILDMCNGTMDFDPDDFSNALEEVCSALDVDYPSKKLVLRPK